MKKVVAILIVALLVVIGLFWLIHEFASQPCSNAHSQVVFEVLPGQPLAAVASSLNKDGLVENAKEFTWYAKFTGDAKRIKVGQYQLYKDMTPRQVLDVITSGESIRYSLVVPEGDNIFEIREALNKLWPRRGDEFLQFVTNRANVRRITGHNWPSMEGYLFPDTYLITKYTPISVLVREMYSHFEQTIRQIDQHESTRMSERDQVILASMIEKETGDPKERTIISSVFHNRLKIGMRLQSDPTIIYGLWLKTGRQPFDITRADIAEKTAYNTYRIPALPPGPIANPGKAALWAAVNPARTQYLYFVSRNNGTHVFSKTYREQERYVRMYQLNPAARAGKSWRELSKKLMHERNSGGKSAAH